MAQLQNNFELWVVISNFQVGFSINNNSF